ncbi:accessory factor UbiK family protein [Sulfurivirga sp.]|uniref:accessory factor UbiK family protein n=1 Tax=Sulfurivirga sp. TaxID=2614236 RepID=UPI0025D2DFCF|nr:accessory factor UbiK family protein [Sulfurivirga sp.]
MQPDQIAQVISRVFQQLPPNLGALPEDARHALRLALQKALSDLDLVTREEFEVQQQVLWRTRQKVEALERRLDVLTGADKDILD